MMVGLVSGHCSICARAYWKGEVAPCVQSATYSVSICIDCLREATRLYAEYMRKCKYDPPKPTGT